MALALEDVENSFGADKAIAEKKSEIVRRKGRKLRRAKRGHLPLYAPREEVGIEPKAVTVKRLRSFWCPAPTHGEALPSYVHKCARSRRVDTLSQSSRYVRRDL
jgi:hypothetical protein